MPSSRYPTLFFPRPVTLPNRIIMGSMHAGLEAVPGASERLAAFYAERARGGAALIITGGCSPNEAGRMDHQPGPVMFCAKKRPVTSVPPPTANPTIIRTGLKG